MADSILDIGNMSNAEAHNVFLTDESPLLITIADNVTKQRFPVTIKLPPLYSHISLINGYVMNEDAVIVNDNTLLFQSIEYKI